MKASEILRAGLERLGPEGEFWCKGSFAISPINSDENYDAPGCKFCSIGAIRKAAFGIIRIPIDSNSNLLTLLNFRQARALQDKVIGNRGRDIAFWQDDPNRTFPEVKAKFLEAIALAEKAEAAE